MTRATLDTLRNSSAATVSRITASEILDVDPRTVSRGIADGTIPAIKVGRRVVIPREPFLAMLTTRAVGQASA